MNNNIFNYVSIGLVIILIIALFKNRDTFKSIRQETDDLHDEYYRNYMYTNQVVPAQPNNNVTKSDLSDLLNVLINTKYSNGSPKGENTSFNQSKYDLIFKDIIVNSNRRNVNIYPNPNSYSIKLNINIDKIYKAELIDVYIPAATDIAVNIPTSGNRLYFSYVSTITINGYVEIQAGTYLSPDLVGKELTRQFNIVLRYGGLVLSSTLGINVIYNKNLNRYIIQDLQPYNSSPTITIYSQNGYQYSPTDSVINSIAYSLMLYSQPVYYSGPQNIDTDSNGILYVGSAEPGNYGEANGNPVPLTSDILFSNSIISDLVLTNDKIYLSLGQLNGDTCSVPNDESGLCGEVGNIFCQVPNNTCVSSASVKTLLNQPHVFSAIQFYNPPINKVNKLDIKWLGENGKLLRILEHGFTIRIYYFQKRLGATDFSHPVP
jgi:hypothetical protein